MGDRRCYFLARRLDICFRFTGVPKRWNAVAPGFVETEMSDRLKESLSDEQFAALQAKHPLGTGTAGDVAAGIAFLLSDSARWMTGTTMVIDGGYTAHS